MGRWDNLVDWVSDIDWSETGTAVTAGAATGATIGAVGGAGALSWLTGPIGSAIGAGVGLAIFIMVITKTIHPPTGANPIIVILGGKGLGFVFLPVAIGAITIVIYAIIYNKIIGKKYPKSSNN